MRVVPVGLVLVTGCAFVFRIDEVPPGGGSGSGSGDPIAYRQGSAAVPASSSNHLVTVAYPAPLAKGDLAVVIAGWGASSGVLSVSDNLSNRYQQALPPAGNQTIWYAEDVNAGTATVTVQYLDEATFPDIRILEYGGIATADSIDDKSGMSGTGEAMMAGDVTTRHAYDVLVAGTTISTQTATVGPSFDQRFLTVPDGDYAGDRIVTSAQTYSVVGSQSANGTWWSMQVVAFKGALDAPP